MSWRPIDFQGIINLDRKITEQLERYLQEKETRLANQILHIFQFEPNEVEVFSPTLPLTSGSVKLSEAVEGFSKKVRHIIKNMPAQLTSEEGSRVVKEINQVLWDYTEVLEGCVVELFQQVKQVAIDRWHISISQVVQAIKDMLIHRMDDLIWAIRRLEKPLKDYCQRCQGKKKTWRDWSERWRGWLDPDLLRNLQKSESFLKTRYEEFNHRYNEYMQLSTQVEENLDKMKTYPVLALLDVYDQNLYVDVFRLLRLLELNRHPKKEVALETARALKNLTSVDSVMKLFRQYFREIKYAFFNSSLEWKSLNHDEPNFQEAWDKLKVKVQEYQHELQQLKHTMSRYRLFMLKHDANPYVRSRWGFTEWIVGPEPTKARKLLNLVYSADEFDGYFSQFLESLVRDPLDQQHREYMARQEIDKVLHEMGQPLISHSMMCSRVEKLLEQLRVCDEVGSSHMSTIHYVEDILAKAMREDWKYHVLHEFPLFHQMYRLHQGLSDYREDPSHAFRLERFNHLFDQIEDWVAKEDVYAHVHEIDLDINDMKTYLQDFLASLQRSVKEKSQDPFLDETIQKFRQQLLEYRYLFGQFIFTILAKNQEGQQLRHQFLFVDQYFESIENLLYELKLSWEGKR